MWYGCNLARFVLSWTGWFLVCRRRWRVSLSSDYSQIELKGTTTKGGMARTNQAEHIRRPPLTEESIFLSPWNSCGAFERYSQQSPTTKMLFISTVVVASDPHKRLTYRLSKLSFPNSVRPHPAPPPALRRRALGCDKMTKDQREKLTAAEEQISRLSGRNLDPLTTKELQELTGLLKRALDNAERMIGLRL